MKLFQKLPERFFSLLSASKKELYVEALFVLREAFLTEMEIRRDDLAAMLMDRLEDAMLVPDFLDDSAETGEADDKSSDNGIAGAQSIGNSEEDLEDPGTLSGRAHLLIRRMRETGWLEVEFDSQTFEYYITVPDYAVAMLDVLYSLTQEKVQEYNSFVYATFAALENSDQTRDYYLQALLTAHQNTENLIRELKSLYNNIRRYQQSALNEMSANVLLAEHFDAYREQIVNAVYYPLKTIDSVPRFKHRILNILNRWAIEDVVLDVIIAQGMERHLFENEESGRESVLEMINFIADTYETVEDTIGKIDARHAAYTKASADRIRYIISSDRSARGKLADLLQHSKDEQVMRRMQEGVSAYRHEYADHGSLYARVRRTRRTEGKPLAIEAEPQNEALVSGFLKGIRKKYSNQKIDQFILSCMGDNDAVTSEQMPVDSDESFVLLLLGTLRGREKSAPFSVEFLEDHIENGSYLLPAMIFRKRPS